MAHPTAQYPACRCTLVALLMCLATSATAQDLAFEVVPGQRQLFLDNAGIAEIDSLKQTLHQPIKKGAVIRPTYPAEMTLQTRSAPAWDPEARLWKMWLVNSGDYSGSAFAQSRDGLHWTKPALGQVEVNGSRENSYITIDPSLGWPANLIINVVRDPHDPDPARRFKGLGHAWGREPLVSPDGIHWTKLDVPKIFSADESNMSYDRLTRTFMATVKTSSHYGRAQALTTSTDFENWTEPVLVFEADDLDQQIGRENIEARRADTSLQQMVSDDPSYYNVDVYNMGVFRYESLYIGTPVMYHATGPSADGNNTDGFKLIQLACSRDLKHWQRVADRKTFLGPSLLGSGAYDLTGLLGPSRAVIRGDELWFYYTGAKYRRPPPRAEPDAGAVCLAVLRRDGFVSLDSGQQAGTMLTRPFKLHGDKLFVNVDAPQGELRVEALDNHGRVEARSQPLQGDLIGALVNWTQGDLADLKGQSVRLRFTSRKAQFYSYWVENSLVNN
ncbi:MAG: hypothetical protein CMJ81_06340 [Planctomycetaceae bacterium]|nr:hypothetical protein [Planctomycetaceae bacterium]MBP60497.1 hypothetical protein [Planctomycetaceae bacterium]